MGKSGPILKMLSIFESGLFIKIVSVFITGLWIAGVILGNVYVIILALALLAALSTILYIHRDNLKEIFQGDSSVVVEDERTQLINEKAATMTLGILIAIIIWIGIIVLAIRNSHPQYQTMGYLLIAVAMLCFILYFSARIYYSRKY
jgi:uncharacterized membrane protein